MVDCCELKADVGRRPKSGNYPHGYSAEHGIRFVQTGNGTFHDVFRAAEILLRLPQIRRSGSGWNNETGGAAIPFQTVSQLRKDSAFAAEATEQRLDISKGGRERLVQLRLVQGQPTGGRTGNADIRELLIDPGSGCGRRKGPSYLADRVPELGAGGDTISGITLRRVGREPPTSDLIPTSASMIRVDHRCHPTS